MEIILLRHTTVDNPEKKCYGISEMQLATSFEQEGAHIKNKISIFKPDKIYTSSSIRCIRLAEKLGSSIEICESLMELNFGKWEGKSWDSIDKEELSCWMDNFVLHVIPNGESYIQLFNRVQTWFNECIISHHPDNRLLIISHAGPIRAIIASLLSINLYNSFNIKVAYGDSFRIILESDGMNCVYFK